MRRLAEHAREPTLTNRESWVDWLKALSIVVVVWIHSRTLLRGDSTWLALFDRASLVAVPSFFFVAGYTLRRSRGSLQRRLRRILLPYLLASAVVVAWTQPPLERLPMIVLSGYALGIYYFVPMLMVTLSIVALVARASLRSRRVLLALLVVLGVGGLIQQDPLAQWVYPRGQGMYWITRNPFRWIGFVAAGYAVGDLVRRPGRRIGLALIALLAALTFVMLPIAGNLRIGTIPFALSTAAMIYSAIAVVALVAGSDAVVPRGVQWLSDNTYPIYLWHLPVMLAATASLGTSATALCVAIGAGIVIPLALAKVAKDSWPSAREWVG